MAISPKTLVEKFYFEVWNKADEQVAHEILHPDFRFRASLGPERRGPEGFISYMRSIHQRGDPDDGAPCPKSNRGHPSGTVDRSPLPGLSPIPSGAFPSP